MTCVTSIRLTFHPPQHSGSLSFHEDTAFFCHRYRTLLEDPQILYLRLHRKISFPSETRIIPKRANNLLAWTHITHVRAEMCQSTAVFGYLQSDWAHSFHMEKKLLSYLILNEGFFRMVFMDIAKVISSLKKLIWLKSKKNETFSSHIAFVKTTFLYISGKWI